MPKKIVEIGYRCDVCEHVYYGPGSEKLAKMCEQSGIPEPMIAVGSVLEVEIDNDNKIAVKIKGYSVVPCRGIHTILYECNVFAKFNKHDCSGVWRAYSAVRSYTEDVFDNSIAWKEKMILA